MKTQINPLLGEEARAIRQRCGLTQTQLGSLFGRSRMQIGRYEKTGNEVPDPIAWAYRGVDAVLGKKDAADRPISHIEV